MFKKFASSAIIAISILSAASAAGASTYHPVTLKKSWSGALTPYFGPAALSGTATVKKFSNGQVGAEVHMTGLEVGDYQLQYRTWSRGGDVNQSVVVCNFHAPDPALIAGCGAQMNGLGTVKYTNQAVQVFKLPIQDTRQEMAYSELSRDAQ